MTFHPDQHARIVIIGGGAIGCSLAYHLARSGERDVLLLEKAQITHGSTWHAAGLVGQLRSKQALTRLMQNSVAVFDRLAAETGVATDWKKVGSLRLAASADRWSEIRRSMQLAKSFGLECQGLSSAEAKEMFPHIDPKGVVGAAFIPSDGYIDPYALTQAYCAGARAAGAKIREGITVTDIQVEQGRVLGVVTDQGNIGCDVLVNCAGVWAKRVGEMAGVALAAGVVEHQYFVTEKGLDLPADLVTLRDPDSNFYLKPDVGGAFAIGGWEEGTKGCWQGQAPDGFARQLFPENLDRLERFATLAADRLPILNHIGIKTIINGPIPVSPDGEPIMGPVPDVENFFVACGFTAGIAASGGAGQAMANWIIEGDPGLDLWPFDVRRFGPAHAQAAYLEDRAIEAYAAYYKVHWPGEENQAGRGLRRSPLHNAAAARGAVFGSKSGWERANWFRASDPDSQDTPSFEGRPGWFGAVGAEVDAIRNRAALIDQTSFSKFEISSPGTQQALQHVVANDLSGPPGRAIYTQMCNDHGGIEADVTFVHTGPDRFLMITGSGFGVRDGNWLKRHLPAAINVADVTNTLAVLNICGPNSRDILQSVSPDDLSNAAFPFLGARRIDIGHATALAVRIGYVGELGFELYIDQEFAGHVHDVLHKAGGDLGLADAGYRAIESCRLEKGYLYWSADISPQVNPYEAGLGFAVALDKPEFTGRAALEKIRARGAERQLVTLSVDGFAPLIGSETVLVDGKPVSTLTSAGYGHHLARTIGFCLMKTGLETNANVEIEAYGIRHPARIGPRCLYDAAMERLKS